MLIYNDLVKAKKGPIPVLDFISNAEIDGQREAGWRARAGEVLTQVGMREAGDAIAACPSGFIIISSEDKATHKKSSSGGGTLNKISAAIRTRRILIFQVPKVPIH